MMQNIIQNIETFSFLIQSGQKTFYFPKNFSLTGRKINRIHLFSNIYFDSFDNSSTVAPTSVLGYILVSLKNIEGKQIVQSLPAPILCEFSRMRIQINDVIDFEDSYIIINAPESPSSYNLLVAFEYETSDRQPVSEWKNVERVFIPRDASLTYRKYRLSDYKVSGLVGRRVSKIICNNNRYAQLHLRCFDDRIIKIPFIFLSDSSLFTVPGKSVLFENLQIDFENSFIETKNNQDDYEMIFYYE